MYMLRAIMAGDYKLNTPEWDDISEPPKDLVSTCPQPKLGLTLPMLRLLLSKAQHKDAKIFENHCNSVMLVLIG